MENEDLEQADDLPELPREAGSPARSPIGTAKGNKQRIAEFKKRLLSAKVGETMIRKMIEIAKDDSHPGQIAALKMCMDRILPLSAFEDRKDGSRTAIQITISGVGDSAEVVGSGSTAEDGDE